MTNHNTITIEDAKLVLRNFEGREGMYERAGDRSFGVLLSEEIAESLELDGWNVKYFKPREVGDVPEPWLQVAVGYKVKPPKVVMITSQSRVHLTEDTIALLDSVDVKTVDLIIRPYHWTVTGKSGIKAYLQTMFVTIEEDELELKYACESEGQYDE